MKYFNYQNKFIIFVFAITLMVGLLNPVISLAATEPQIFSRSSSNGNTFLVKEDGTVWAWGRNGDAQLGIGSTADKSTPVKISNLTGVKQISAGAFFTVALKDNGTVMAWGTNGSAQLGIGNLTNKSTPVNVPNLTGVKQIEVGNNHTIVLKDDGTVWTWGSNESQQLGGVGKTLIYRNTPVKVPNLAEVKRIDTGYTFNFAIKEDGTVWAWGDNCYGQLGIENTTTQRYPVQIPNLAGAKQISGGRWHTLALMEDGTVMAWGRNHYGQLGIGNTTDQLFPVQIPNLTGVKQINTGAYCSVALMEDGTIRAWGDNSNGQLGIGNTTGQLFPVQIPNLTGVKQISTGFKHFIALMRNGTFMAWGYNLYGQLGIGNTTDQLSPVKIPNLQVQLPPDTSPPIVTIAPYNKNPTNQDIAVSATTDKGTLNASSHTFTENGSFEFVATDDAGNVTKKTVTITNIDKTPPTVPQIAIENDKYLVIGGSTDTGSGLDRYEYRLNNGDFLTYTNVVELGDGEYTVNAKAIDKAGNEAITSETVIINTENPEIIEQKATEAVAKAEETHSQTDVDTARALVNDLPDSAEKTDLTNRLDTVQADIDEAALPPVITIAPYNTNPTNKDITVSATTDKGTLNTTSHVFTENGSFEFVATDEAGNITKQTVTITNIDKVAPTTPATIVVDYNILTINDSTDAESGLSGYLYQINNGEWTAYEDAITLDDGQYIIKVKAIDIAGNESSVTTIIYTVYKAALDNATNIVNVVENNKNQEDFETARALVNDLPDGAEKTDLTNRLNVVQTIITTDAVEVAETAKTQEAIDAARTLVNDLPDGAEKINLTNRLNTIITPETSAVISVIEKAEKYPSNRSYIIDALEKATALSDTVPQKADLVTRATALKDAYNNAIDEAKYADNVAKATHYVVQSEKNSTSYNINKAQEYINLLPEGDSVRIELQARLDAVKDVIALAELNKAIQNAEKAVANAEKYIKASYVDKAQPLIDALPDIAETQALQDRLDAVQEEIALAELTKAIQNAEKAVANAEKYIKASYVDKAQPLIDALPDIAEKQALQDRLDIIVLK